MRIGWVGGLDRNESHLSRLAARYGHTIDFHTGHVGGRGADELRSLVERADFVILLTDVDSHGAVTLGRRLAQKLGRGVMVARNCGSSHFQALLEALSIRDGRHLPPGMLAAS